MAENFVSSRNYMYNQKLTCPVPSIDIHVNETSTTECITLTTNMTTNQTDFPTPAPSTDPMLLEYEIMDVNAWTKVVVTIPFAMCCFFGVLLIVFHKMKSNHERQQIHPVKPVEV